MNAQSWRSLTILLLGFVVGGCVVALVPSGTGRWIVAAAFVLMVWCSETSKRKEEA